MGAAQCVCHLLGNRTKVMYDHGPGFPDYS
jgi:hypothetical protein